MNSRQAASSAARSSSRHTKLVHLGRVKGAGGGRIEISDLDGAEAIAIGTGPEGRDGVIEFFDTDGQTTDSVRARAPMLPPADEASPR